MLGVLVYLVEFTFVLMVDMRRLLLMVFPGSYIQRHVQTLCRRHTHTPLHCILIRDPTAEETRQTHLNAGELVCTARPLFIGCWGGLRDAQDR